MGSSYGRAFKLNVQMFFLLTTTSDVTANSCILNKFFEYELLPLLTIACCR